MRIKRNQIFKLTIIQASLNVELNLHFDNLCFIIEALTATNKTTVILTSKVTIAKVYFRCFCLNIRYIIWVDDFLYAKTAWYGMLIGFLWRVRHLGSRSVMQWMILLTSLTLLILPFTALSNHKVYPAGDFILIAANGKSNNFRAFLNFNLLTH